MPQPIIIDIPHKLGKAGVRVRLDEGITGIAAAIPGVGQVTHNWEGDIMHFTLATLGQTMRCRATVFEEKVHAEVDLPPMLALFGQKVRDVFGRELPKLLK